MSYHEQTFLPYLAIVKNPKIRSCDLDYDLEILQVLSVCQGISAQLQFNEKNHY